VPHPRQVLGDRGEAIAERFLVGRGYQILGRKYRCREGEIDLVCRDGVDLAFVEVKTRRGTAFGAPEEAVTRAKLAHLAQAGQRYLAAHALEEAPWRIDVVAIQMDARGQVGALRLLVNVGDW